MVFIIHSSDYSKYVGTNLNLADHMISTMRYARW